MYATPESYDDAASSHGLRQRKFDDDGAVVEEGDIEPGIYVAVKGVPYGTRIERPRTGWASTWGGVYIIVNHDKLIFDAGRKSFQANDDYEKVKARIKQVFNDIIVPSHQSFTKPLKHRDPTLIAKKQMELYDESKKWPDLGLSEVPFLKQPRNEQDVVALFHELVAADLLKGYYTRSISIRGTYDSIAEYKVDQGEIGKSAWKLYLKTMGKKTTMVEMPVTIEYKYDLTDLIKDIQDERKFPYHIDILVCWTYDKKKLEKSKWVLERQSDDDILFYGAKHRLIPADPYRISQDQVHVMILEDLVEQLAKGSA